MGIADLWPILSSESDERLAFPVFLTRFIQKYGRFPRLAIDAYMFMFWSQLPGAEDDPNIHRRIIRNFMAKLWYLVQHNVLFVVVFDGKYKPGKLRNGHIPDIPGSTSYDELLVFFKKLAPYTYSEGLSLVEMLKKILQRNCMDYVQAPAEAEAECAWLQRLGVVDFVVSDDSDTLVFGATQMLRLFNRLKYKNENGEDVLSSSDYYVNPVYMDQITDRTGLDRDRLVLVAVLRGGDYSTGALNIGITRASEIALCGSSMLQHSPRKALQDFGAMPDFTRMFTETFVHMESKNCTLTDRYFSLKAELDRNDSLDSFNKYLGSYLKESAKEVFGRMATMKGNLAIDDYYSLLYLFPLVNQKIFKFTPFSVSFSDLNADYDDLPNVNVDCLALRYNFVCSATDIGKLTVVEGTQQFVGYGRGKNLVREKYLLPRERKYNLKSFALKLLSEEKFREIIHLARIKLLDGVSLAVLKFQRQQLNEAAYLKMSKETAHESERVQQADTEADADDPNSLVIDNEEEEEDKSITVAVPLEAVRLIAPSVVEEFEKLKLMKRSPKKKPSPQKTTLDSMWNLLPTKSNLSPTKLESSATKSLYSPKKIESRSSSMADTKSSPAKAEVGSADFRKFASNLDSQAKGSPRRRSNRTALLPGQSIVTSFFRPHQEVDPFQDVIFVPSDEENDPKPADYMNMKNVIANAPLLGQSRLKAPIESRLNSPESSPSKRIRKEFALSPNNSPVKPKREDSSGYPPI